MKQKVDAYPHRKKLYKHTMRPRQHWVMRAIVAIDLWVESVVVCVMDAVFVWYAARRYEAAVRKLQSKKDELK